MSLTASSILILGLNVSIKLMRPILKTCLGNLTSPTTTIVKQNSWRQENKDTELSQIHNLEHCGFFCPGEQWLRWWKVET